MWGDCARNTCQEIVKLLFIYYDTQYLRQLWAGGGLKNRVNSAQTGNLLKDLG
jgi:hypothetical protein